MAATLNNSELLRSPAALTARQFELIVRRLAEDLTYGSDLSRFVGSGTEYAQTRLFALGDPVRAIDWRVTARTGRAHVKDYQATKRVGVFIVVDTSASMRVKSGLKETRNVTRGEGSRSNTRTPTPLPLPLGGGDQGISKFDAAVWIASVLALVAVWRRSPVAILEGCGGEAAQNQRLEPTLSSARVWQAIHGLRARTAEEENRGTDLLGPLEKIEGLTKTVAAVVVLSDLHAPAERGLEPIKRIAARHDCMVGHLVDPAEMQPLRGGFVRALEAETRVDEARDGSGVGSGEHVLTSRSVLQSRVWTSESVRADLIGAGADYALLRTDRPILEPLRQLIEARGGAARKTR